MASAGAGVPVFGGRDCHVETARRSISLCRAALTVNRCFRGGLASHQPKSNKTPHGAIPDPEHPFFLTSEGIISYPKQGLAHVGFRLGGPLKGSPSELHPGRRYLHSHGFGDTPSHLRSLLSALSVLGSQGDGNQVDIIQQRGVWVLLMQVLKTFAFLKKESFLLLPSMFQRCEYS